MDTREPVMIDHLAREEQQREQCMYCGRSLKESKWRSEHHREVLYTISYCECGKKVFVRMPFQGSGDVKVSRSTVFPESRKRKTKLRTLESKIKVLGST